MSHTVLAVGALAVTAAGHVWYLPAVADLRAGDDRPRPTRLAALATLTWWIAAAATAVLLATPAPWQVAAVTAVAGAVSGIALRLTAAAKGRAEQREAARSWAALRYDPAPAAGRPRPQAAGLAWLFGLLAGAVAVVGPIVLGTSGVAAAPVLGAAAVGTVGLTLAALVLVSTRTR